MADQDNHAADANESNSDILSIPDFISGVMTKARKEKDTDEALLDIIEERIIHAMPIISSPASALKDVEALAEKRAKAQDDGVEDAGPDHD